MTNNPLNDTREVNDVRELNIEALELVSGGSFGMLYRLPQALRLVVSRCCASQGPVKVLRGG